MHFLLVETECTVPGHDALNQAGLRVQVLVAGLSGCIVKLTKHRWRWSVLIRMADLAIASSKAFTTPLVGLDAEL